MLRVSTVALLLSGTVVFSIERLQVEPGQNAFMYCLHDIHVPGDLYWFKQTDGAVPITIMCLTFTQNPQKVDKKYFNHFTKERLLLYHFNKSTNLIINNVSISDSGFYFCGAAGDQVKFGNGTRLVVKEKNVISEENVTRNREKDQERSPVCTECSGDIFYTLTLLFGGIIVFVSIIALILAIIREHKRQKHEKVTECQAQQHNKQNDSIEYAAVHFKRRPKTAGRRTEDMIAAYADATET